MKTDTPVTLELPLGRMDIHSIVRYLSTRHSDALRIWSNTGSAIADAYTRSPSTTTRAVCVIRPVQEKSVAT